MVAALVAALRGELAASMGPQADQTAARAEARYAEPDEAYVTRLRVQHECCPARC